jgi:nitrous oxide reductase accessory protein NosL
MRREVLAIGAIALLLAGCGEWQNPSLPTAPRTWQVAS